VEQSFKLRSVASGVKSEIAMLGRSSRGRPVTGEVLLGQGVGRSLHNDGRQQALRSPIREFLYIGRLSELKEINAPMQAGSDHYYKSN
jgi:hypothetical protein